MLLTFNLICKTLFHCGGLVALTTTATAITNPNLALTKYWSDSCCLPLLCVISNFNTYFRKSLITKVTLGISNSKEIRTAKDQSNSLLGLQGGQSIRFSPRINLNVDKNRSTLFVGGFWKIYAPSWICSEHHPSLKSGENMSKRLVFSRI